MRLIRGIAFAAAALLVFGLVPQASADHCRDVFILSGADLGDGNRVGTNPGAISCILDDPDVHPDTNFTVPGALDLWVGVLSLGQEAAPTGTLTIGDSDPIDLEFAMNELRGRWESQTVSLIGVLPGSKIVAEVWVFDDELQTTTYTRI